jgi:hypothetical protein
MLPILFFSFCGAIAFNSHFSYVFLGGCYQLTGGILFWPTSYFMPLPLASFRIINPPPQAGG